MKIRINPISVFPSTATVLLIAGASIKKFSDNGEATISWQLLSDLDEVLSNGIVELTGEEYQGWNDDSPYIENIVLEKLGLTAAT